jgi:hypothetical protein
MISNNELNEETKDSEILKEPITHYVFSKEFVKIYILVVFYLYYGFFYGATYKVIGKDTINDDKFLSLIGAISALNNGVCKFLFAISLDYISFKRCFGVVTLVYIVCIMLMKTAAQSKMGYLLVTVISFSCDGAVSSMMPVLVFKVFGSINGPRVYSYIYSVYFISAFSFILIITYSNDDKNYDS